MRKIFICQNGQVLVYQGKELIEIMYNPTLKELEELNADEIQWV